MSKPKRARSRIYWRDQGGDRRAYADFRGEGGARVDLPVMDRICRVLGIRLSQLLVRDGEK